METEGSLLRLLQPATCTKLNTLLRDYR